MPQPNKRSIIISIVVFLLLLISGFAFLHFQSSDKKSGSKQASAQSDKSLATTPKASDEFGSAVVDNSAVDPSANSSNSNNYLDVSKDDCTNQCQNFTDPDDLKYCQQICNIIPVDTDITAPANCINKKDLDKDYCLKDLTINTKNIKTCSQVSDYNIQKICEKNFDSAAQN